MADGPNSTDPAVGLCSTCRHTRPTTNDRGSTFYRCERSRTDPGFPKYPRLPVLRCTGWESAGER